MYRATARATCAGSGAAGLAAWLLPAGQSCENMMIRRPLS
jgi:hypothetical protein